MFVHAALIVVAMHGDRDGVGAQLVCERLRKLIPDCVSKHMNKSAIFYAGKLCCMSNNNHHDVYLLAQVRHVHIAFEARCVRVDVCKCNTLNSQFYCYQI